MNLKILLTALVALLLVVLVGNTATAQPAGYGVMRVQTGVPLYRAPVRNGVRLTALGIASIFRPVAYSQPIVVDPSTQPRVMMVNPPPVTVQPPPVAELVQPPVCEKCGKRHWPK